MGAQVALAPQQPEARYSSRSSARVSGSTGSRTGAEARVGVTGHVPEEHLVQAVLAGHGDHVVEAVEDELERHVGVELVGDAELRVHGRKPVLNRGRAEGHDGAPRRTTSS